MIGPFDVFLYWLACAGGILFVGAVLLALWFIMLWILGGTRDD